MSLDLEPINELHRQIQNELKKNGMTANELRIGNMVKWQNNGQEFDITLEHFLNPYFWPHIGAGHIIGIALTEEWFNKFGFKIDDIEGYYLQSDICIVETDEGYHLTEADTFNEYSLWIGKPIVHVHQLQNLFFALTGEELNVQL